MPDINRSNKHQTGDHRGGEFDSCRAQQHSFVEIDHEILSVVILTFPLIQEKGWSVSGKRIKIKIFQIVVC